MEKEASKSHLLLHDNIQINDGFGHFKFAQVHDVDVAIFGSN